MQNPAAKAAGFIVLGHAELFAQLCLIQFVFLPKEPQLLAKCHVHFDPLLITK